jgi:hypothetical protein
LHAFPLSIPGSRKYARFSRRLLVAAQVSGQEMTTRLTSEDEIFLDDILAICYMPCDNLKHYFGVKGERYEEI